MENLEWHVERRKLVELKGWDKNPRKISPNALDKLKARITDRGFHDILKIDIDGTVLSGNQRLQALLQLGHIEVDVKAPSRALTTEEKNKVALESNISDGEWDMDALVDFDAALLEAVGFSEKELDKIFKQKGEDDFDAQAEHDLIVTPNAQPGDVYVLGSHRLMCGSSTNPEDVKKLMGEDKADLVFTDPPYNVNYKGQGKKTSTTIENDNMDDAGFRTLLEQAFMNAYAHSKDESAIYVCYASSTHREFEDSLNKANYEVRQQIIWVKQVASMGWGNYRWKHEPILYCHKVGKKCTFLGDRTQYTEWTEQLTDKQLLDKFKKMIEKDEKGGSTVWRLKRDQNYDHPTQKPIQLVKIALANSCHRHGIVLDLFGGGGTTLAAAEESSRACRMMELDPKFVDVIIARWERMTGRTAQKL